VKLYRAIHQLMTIGALLLMPVLACAQTSATAATSASPPSKSAVKVDMVPSLFVMNARSASLQGQTLTLAGVSPTSIVFADRPVRAAGHLPTEALLEEWTIGDFAKDAPNAPYRCSARMAFRPATSLSSCEARVSKATG
jgi:hypothetical protein